MQTANCASEVRAGVSRCEEEGAGQQTWGTINGKRLVCGDVQGAEHTTAHTGGDRRQANDRDCCATDTGSCRQGR